MLTTKNSNAVLSRAKNSYLHVTVSKLPLLGYRYIVQSQLQSALLEREQPQLGRPREMPELFDGKHGWFWRNRADKPVTVTRRTQGDYIAIKWVI
ncbi:putative (L31491) ORF2; putative [Pseudomonas sp. FG-3G]|nr:putative (L31491) ORF2; putative [Pseudomonas sp. FG-3G]